MGKPSEQLAPETWVLCGESTRLPLILAGLAWLILCLLSCAFEAARDICCWAGIRDLLPRPQNWSPDHPARSLGFEDGRGCGGVGGQTP